VPFRFTDEGISDYYFHLYYLSQWVYNKEVGRLITQPVRMAIQQLVREVDSYFLLNNLIITINQDESKWQINSIFLLKALAYTSEASRSKELADMKYFLTKLNIYIVSICDIYAIYTRGEYRWQR
jgi:hypothetical protein